MEKYNKPKARKINVTYDEYLAILKSYEVIENDVEGTNKEHLKHLKKLIEKIIGS